MSFLSRIQNLAQLPFFFYNRLLSHLTKTIVVQTEVIFIHVFRIDKDHKNRERYDNSVFILSWSNH